MVVHGHELHVLAPYKRAHDQTPYATHPVHGNAFHELLLFLVSDDEAMRLMI